MTTRTRYVVLGGAGVLVAGLAGGLGAWLSGNLPGLVLAQERPDELRYLPAEATLISFANVREVMDSELRRRLREIQPDLGRRREFRERTGIDIEEDIDYFVAGLVPEGPNDVGGIAVLTGRFDAARLETLAVAVGGSASEHGGRRLVTVGGDALAMGFLEPGVVALGSEALVRRAVDLPSDGGVDSDERLMGLLRHVGDGSTAWTVGRLDDGAAGEWLPDEVEQQVSQVTGFAVGGRVNGGVSGTLTAEAADEETGRNLRDLLQGFLALARLQADSRPELGGLLDSIRLSAAGATVTLSFELPADVVLELLPDPSDAQRP